MLTTQFYRTEFGHGICRLANRFELVSAMDIAHNDRGNGQEIDPFFQVIRKHLSTNSLCVHCSTPRDKCIHELVDFRFRVVY